MASLVKNVFAFGNIPLFFLTENALSEIDNTG